MERIKAVMQKPREISRVISIQKDNFIGECNRWVGGLSTDIMTDCGLHLAFPRTRGRDPLQQIDGRINKAFSPHTRG